MSDKKVIILGKQHRCDVCLLVGQCYKCPHYDRKYVDNLFKAAMREVDKDGKK
jgi:hypothetical protein